MAENSKLRLLESFVRLNEWNHVDTIIFNIYEGKLDLTLRSRLIEQMTAQLEWFIDPLFQNLSKSRLLKVIKQRPSN